MSTKEESLDHFLVQLETGMSLDLPVIADGFGLSWFRDVVPEIKRNPEYASRVMLALQAIRFKLLNSLHESATTTRKGGSATHVKELIRLIDSGEILGFKVEEGGSISAEEIEGLKEMMNESKKHG